jgi:hypothetical protein
MNSKFIYSYLYFYMKFIYTLKIIIDRIWLIASFTDFETNVRGKKCNYKKLRRLALSL